MTNTPLLETTAKEVDGALHVYEGEFPQDMLGTVYIVYQIGSVNSNGLPYPERLPDGSFNHEYGSAIMSGDGMVMKLDLSKTPTIKTRIMKTPCYYADWNTREGTQESHADFGGLRFRNFGIARMSLILGSRNPLNTAVTPARFGNDAPVLIAAYDIGRPYVLDPVSLELKTVIGRNTEWMTGAPARVPWPFELIESTAHPCYDPRTKELYSVNYSRMERAVIIAERTIHHLKHNQDLFKEKLVGIMEKHEKSSDLEAARNRVIQFFSNLDKELSSTPPPRPGFLGRLGASLKDLLTSAKAEIKGILGKKKEQNPSGTAVTLMRFDGTGAWNTWVLEDQHGQLLEIKNCMHQTGLTRDYIILQDSSFKFSSELLVNNPFPEHLGLERFLRKTLSTTMLPYTECYVVRRRDLVPGRKSAIAYKLDKPLPIETIHFSCDYENPDGQITMYGIHNAAMCVAEWVRPYDLSAFTGNPIDPEVLSLFSLGTMDVSRLGKWKIDAENNRLLDKQSTVIARTGDTSKTNQIGFNTWTIGLYTYRDIIAAEETVDQIEHLWFVSGGLEARMLTQFIEDLYEKYPNRKVPYPKVKEITQQGVPSSLNYLNTKTMTSTATGYFESNPDDYLRSVQFVPRKVPTPGIEKGLDGYLVCSVQVAHKAGDSLQRRGEFWIFSAENIAKGPLCKMFHPEVNFCFTLHSAWLADPQPCSMAYQVDVKRDYQQVIAGLPDRKVIEPFFEKYVYPYFSPAQHDPVSPK